MKKLITFAENVYADGGYYEFGLGLNDFEQTSSFVASFVEKLFDASHIFRPAIKSMGNDREFLEEVAKYEALINKDYSVCASSCVITLKNAIFYDNIAYLKNSEKYSQLYYSSRSIDVPYAKHLEFEKIDVNSLREIFVSGRDLVYLGSVGSFNYGHFLIDELAKIKFISKIDKPITILMQSVGPIDAVKIDAMSLFLKDRDIQFKFILPDEAVFCPEISYITPISFHPYIKNINAIKYINAQTEKCFVREGGKRIFISRNNAIGRTIKNIDKLIPILNDYGFEIIKPEKLSLKKQAEIFYNAEIIVGIMGAAMCNSLFSPPNIKTLYLAPSGWIEPFYWDLAASIGHEYNVIYGERENINDLAHLDDFTIDPAILTNKLKELVC